MNVPKTVDQILALRTEDLEAMSDDQIREMLKPHLHLFLPGQVIPTTASSPATPGRKKVKVVTNFDSQGMLRMLEQAKELARKQIAEQTNEPNQPQS